MSRCAAGGCLHLLSSFVCHVDGGEVRLPTYPRRLVILLALGERRRARQRAAEELWPNVEVCTASRRFRYALWQIRRLTGEAIVRAGQDSVMLAEGVHIDVTAARGLAQQVLAGCHIDDWGPLGLPLLPESDDDEVHAERQRWDRLRLLALERLAVTLLARGDVPGAIAVADCGVRVDPLNEGPHRILAEANLARHDMATARRVYDDYRADLHHELGVEPSLEFRRLLKR
ncbi:BTAD domain-containing putative transcriptional regulator [Actinomadura sp. 6N118]|uniref:AfsR/SARP family transcriptional regulator n=1 Tax=Actinomadura sp. 6N118 TaxID=3375151 RepID=UPI003795E735